MTGEQSITLQLLRRPDFRRFSLARFLWGCALQSQNVAVGWFVYDLSHSALMLGLAGLAAFLPAFGLALPAGQVADMVDRRLIVIASFATMSLISLGLFGCSLVGRPALPVVYVLIVAYGSARAFGNPATQALLPNLVPRELFGRAVTLASTFWQSATILGPAVGGFLYAIGPQVVFSAASLAFAGAAVAIARVAHRAPPRPRETATWSSLLAGIAFLRSRPILLGAVSLDLFAVLLGGATALLPIYAQTILGTGPWGLGLLRSMPGLGAVAMSVALAFFPIVRAAGTRLFVAVAVFGVATIAFGLSENLWISMSCLFVVGAADMVSVVVRLTLVQGETPDEMRGRVSAVNTVFIGASNELGEFESGALAAWLGAVRAVVLGGIGTVAIAALWSRLFPDLRNRDRLIA